MPQTDTTDSDDPDDGWMFGGSESSEARYIGPYLVLEKLGTGGMSDVFRVLDEKLGREIALKLIRPSPFLNADVRSTQEIRLLKRLNHDGIVRLLGEGVFEGQTYFTMECIDGLSLADLLSKNREANRAPCSTVRELLAPMAHACLLGGPMGDLSEDAPAYIGAIRITQQIAVTLDYLHGQKIVHRDVKPSNILLKPNGRVLLTDLGIAHYSQQSAVTALTKPNTFLGTERYASPEQYRSQAVDGRTDVYGLGAVLYELVCGVRLFDNIENANELVSDVLRQHPKSPILFVPQIPRRLNEVILKALHKIPDERFATAFEFAEALQEFIVPRPPTLLEKARQTGSWIVQVFFLMGLAISGGATVAIYCHDRLQQLDWGHPLLPALIPLAVTIVLGISIAGIWYILCLIWVLFGRFWTWLCRPKLVES